MARLNPEQRKEAESIADNTARRRRKQPAVENISNIPDRATTDDAGRVSGGLGRQKLKFQTLTEAEQATNSTDSRVLASGETNPERAVDGINIKRNAVGGDHINNGVVGDAHINGRLAKTSVPSDAAYKVNGRVPASDLNVAGLSDKSANDDGKAVDLKSYKGRNEAVDGALSRKAGKREVGDLKETVSQKFGRQATEDKIRGMVKPGSLKKQ